MDDVFRWNLWNLDHIAEHGIHAEEAEFVITAMRSPFPEKIGHGKWRARGQTAEGRYIQVIFLVEEKGYYVIHARDLSEHEKRQLRRRRR